MNNDLYDNLIRDTLKKINAELEARTREAFGVTEATLPLSNPIDAISKLRDLAARKNRPVVNFTGSKTAIESLSDALVRSLPPEPGSPDATVKQILGMGLVINPAVPDGMVLAVESTGKLFAIVNLESSEKRG